MEFSFQNVAFEINYLDSCKIYFVLDCKSLTISFLRRIPGHCRAIAIVSNCVVVECKTAMQISRIFDDCLRIILLGIPATARTTRVETPTWGRTFCDFEETIYDFDTIFTILASKFRKSSFESHVWFWNRSPKTLFKIWNRALKTLNRKTELWKP